MVVAVALAVAVAVTVAPKEYFLQNSLQILCFTLTS